MTRNDRKGRRAWNGNTRALAISPASRKRAATISARAAVESSPSPSPKLLRAQRCCSAFSNLAEGLGVEPSCAIPDACRVSSAVAYRPPRPLWQEARDSNSAIAGLESAALPIEPVNPGRGRRDRTPLAHHQSTVFETARRPFTVETPYSGAGFVPILLG
jgi:hypothetical protein